MAGVASTPQVAKIFGERFESLMRQHHETAATAATKLNVSAAIIAKWRQGKVVPSGEYLARIAKSYQISIDYLVGMVEAPTPIADKKAMIAEYTGLTLDAIEALHSAYERIISAEDITISTKFYEVFSGTAIERLFHYYCGLADAEVAFKKQYANIKSTSPRFEIFSRNRWAGNIKVEKIALENRICELLTYIASISVADVECSKVLSSIVIEPEDRLLRAMKLTTQQENRLESPEESEKI